MEVCHSLMDVIECRLEMPLRIWKELLFAWCMIVLKYCHLLQQWDWKFNIISGMFLLIPWGMYLSHSSLQLPIYISLRYVHCFNSDLSPKRQSLIIIYSWVYKGRSKPHCFFLYVCYFKVSINLLLMLLFIVLGCLNFNTGTFGSVKFKEIKIIFLLYLPLS